MTQDQYTHEFKFEVNGAFIRGQCEFNTDEKVSFKITEWSQPLAATLLDDFSDLFGKVKAIFDKNDEKVTKITIKEK
jgi:hypothetical protein